MTIHLTYPLGGVPPEFFDNIRKLAQLFHDAQGMHVTGRHPEAVELDNVYVPKDLDLGARADLLLWVAPVICRRCLAEVLFRQQLGKHILICVPIESPQQLASVRDELLKEGVDYRDHPKDIFFYLDVGPLDIKRRVNEWFKMNHRKLVLM